MSESDPSPNATIKVSDKSKSFAVKVSEDLYGEDLTFQRRYEMPSKAIKKRGENLEIDWRFNSRTANRKDD